MAKIIKLDTITTNRIAAGEVIERVASVVKELVENALDAEAKNIKIGLVESGLTEIMVSDDGVGMDYADAKMAIEAHATSKIKDGNDLFNIHTLGFRGEALPSIVSVSNFRLKTSTDGFKGLMYTLKGGEFISEAMVGASKGTEVRVRNLFFNTPARLQNLGSATAELSYITDYITKTAMGHPEVSFSLTNNEKIIFQTYGNNDTLEVILAAYDATVARDMAPIFNDNGYFKISGYISKGQVARSSKNHITLAVNGRIVRNTNIINAVCSAYSNYLVGGRYPIVFLKIDVDHALIDVNVHPAKLEVRFSSEDELLTLIETTIKKRLEKVEFIPQVQIKKDREDNKSSNDDTSSENKLSDNKLSNENKSSNDDTSSEDKSSGDDTTSEDSSFDVVQEEHQEVIVEALDDDLLSLLAKDLGFNPQEASNPSPQTPNAPPVEANEEFSQQEYNLTGDDSVRKTIDALPKMHYLGQLFGTYLITQAEEAFFLIDQHAANERINYEKILNQIQKEEILMYDLLVPLKLDFSLNEALLIDEKLDILSSLKLDVENFGSGSFILRALPTWIPRGMEKEFAEGIISEVIYGKKQERWQFLDDLAKSLACKRSIKANEYKSAMEIDYLLNDLTKANNPYTCPHGRPVIIKFSKDEIERWFKRVL